MGVRWRRWAALALGAALFLGGCASKETPARPAPAPSEPSAAPEPEPSASVQAPETLRFVDAWGEWHEAEIDPAVEKHRYDWSCLTNRDGAISYEGDGNYTLRKGVDVSQFQGDIDWEQVRADGYDFAFVRVAFRGYGEAGILMEDKNYRRNIQQARAAGLDVGAYFFSQAVNEAEAVEEAELILQCLEGLELTLPVVFDPEHIRDVEARTDQVTGEQFTRNALAFCARVQEAGYQPMIYSNLIWESFYFDLKALADIPLWYADYEPVPQTPYRFTFWQYSNQGQVAGIEGDTDLDAWFCPTEKGE